MTEAHPDSSLVAELSDALVAARHHRTPLPMPPWLGRLPDAATAYAVQARVGRSLGWFGDALPTHWKSGGPSRDATLTHAGLPPGGVRLAGAAGTEVDLRDLPFQRRGIEAEVALRLGRALEAAEVAAWRSAPDRGLALARAAVDAMAVTIEVVDSRWQLPPPADADKAEVALLNLADQQVHGALVVGDWRPFDPRDWSRQRCELKIGEQPWQRFEGTHPLGEPTWLLPAWLAHLTRDGLAVPAGTVVTTGSWSGLADAAAGDRVEARFEGIGAVSLRL